MLAYTPLHRLLLQACHTTLVMTSGNRSDEPIATGLEEARERLAGIADAFLMHDREIVSRYDDSVVRVVDEELVFLRRARGYSPLPLDLPVGSPTPILAVGPHLKNTFTLVHGRRAYTSQHIGDLEDVESLEHFRAALARSATLFDIMPTAVVRDLHPEYLSTTIAGASGLQPVVAVQHHHAHIAAVMAEHGHAGPVIGVAYDGTGYGDDGNIWGSEILYADLMQYRRLGHLRYAPLPGGDVAARAPWRCALGYQSLASALAPLGWSAQGVDPMEHAIVRRQVLRRINTPLASSMGRLFDAAASILGVRQKAVYEGQAAMELEALASRRPARPLPYGITSEGDGWVVDPLPTLTALGERVVAGDDVRALAAAFHETITAATRTIVHRASRITGCHTVALGGGCFQNARLLSTLRRALADVGFTVLIPRQLSPNDGAVSVGQAAVAAARLAGLETTIAPSRARTFAIGG
jgi:hydrogenase maturation protein HypF